MFHRQLQISPDKSFFLFGPRGVGKTTFLEQHMNTDTTIFLNLLHKKTRDELSYRDDAFQLFLQNLDPSIQWVVIDEIQKLPFLLDEVQHSMYEHPSVLFALTGSSARKLKRGAANLLAGRAYTYAMGPLLFSELGESFDLDKALRFGTLPRVWLEQHDEDKIDFLYAYADTYLKEEIQEEAVVRKLPSFEKFLKIAASLCGKILSFEHIARDTGVQGKTIRSYYTILEDTLLGYMIPAYRSSIRTQVQTHPKFYYFDVGISQVLSGRVNYPLDSTAWGRAFEHFIVTQLVTINHYGKHRAQFSYFATRDMEIDLIIERQGRPLLCVEIKSTKNVHDQMLSPLKRILKDMPYARGVCICNEPFARMSDDIHVLPWKDALNTIFELA